MKRILQENTQSPRVVRLERRYHFRDDITENGDALFEYIQEFDVDFQRVTDLLKSVPLPLTPRQRDALSATWDIFMENRLDRNRILTGKYRVSNQELARRLKVTEARVSQLRHGIASKLDACRDAFRQLWTPCGNNPEDSTSEFVLKVFELLARL